jgi:hypothetical protein
VNGTLLAVAIGGPSPFTPSVIRTPLILSPGGFRFMTTGAWATNEIIGGDQRTAVAGLPL